jgi:hypothetical protein
MKLIAFSSPVDASRYLAGGSNVAPGIALVSIDYSLNAYSFQVQNPDGTLHPQVNGVNVTTADQNTAAADIRAVIAAAT